VVFLLGRLSNWETPVLQFVDRADAGRQLARKLDSLRGQDVVVLGLPRGGVPVAFEVAQALDAPLDVIVVRKLGVPFQPELAMGAIGEGDTRFLDAAMCARAGVTETELRAIESRERTVLQGRAERLRRGRPRLDLDGRIALIVDDGMSYGSTARVACQVARQLGAARVVVAVPVAPAGTVGLLIEADDVVCISMPQRFLAVGDHYEDFSATSEDEVVGFLDAATRPDAGRP
jgi:putative phosphoribosyl transferase